VNLLRQQGSKVERPPLKKGALFGSLGHRCVAAFRQGGEDGLATRQKYVPK